jgi:hypothetical protein
MRNVPTGDRPNGPWLDGRNRRGLAVECHELDLEGLAVGKGLRLGRICGLY